MRSPGAWRPRGLLVLVLVVGAVAPVLTSCGSEGAPSPASVTGSLLPADYHADEVVLRVHVEVGYAEARVVTQARLLAGDQSLGALIYPLDGTDPGFGRLRVPLVPGDRVPIEGLLLAPCSVPHEVLVFEVVSETNGVPRTDRFTPADPTAYRHAQAEWCDRPVTMVVAGMTISPAGDYEVSVDFHNPGPESATVTSARIDDGTSRWEEITVVLPAGTTQLTFRGHGRLDCAITPPWASGAVRLDGEVIRPESEEWC